MALVLTAAAVLIRHPLSPVLGDRAPFLFAFLAIVLAAWYGGFGPGMLATLAGGAIAAFLWQAPKFDLRVDDPGDVLALFLYLVVGTMISAVSEARARAERHFRGSQGRYQATLEALNEGYVAFDRDWRYVYVNAAAERMLRKSREELLDRTLLEVFPEFRDTPFLQAAEEAVAAGRPLERHDFYAPLGAWFENRLFPTERGAALFFRDITDRKRAEEERDQLLAAEQQARADLEAALAAQREGESRLRFALEAGKMGAWEWDLSSDQMLWSNNLQHLLGLEVDGEPDRFSTVVEHIHPEDRGRIRQYAAEIRDRGEAGEVEFRVRQPEGQVRWLAARARLFVDADTGHRRIAGLTQDITDRKQAAEALHESNERFRLAAAALDGVVYDWDLRRNTVDRSDGLHRLLGYASDATTSNPDWWLEQIHPDDRGAAEEKLAEALRRGWESSREYRVRHRDSSYRWVWDQAIIVRDDNGSAVRLIGTTVDITARKHAEENLLFLARASEELASSLDYEATLAAVARLAVPQIADWCAIDLQEEPGAPLHRLAVAHVDPEKVKWARELEQRYPSDPDSPTGVPQVIRTGQSELYSHIPDELLVAGARDEEHLEIIRSLGMTSAMLVPLSARGRQLGAITLVSAESHRHYTDADLEFAEDLGRRAGTAVDNARLYEATENARYEAELQREQLAERTAELEFLLRATEAVAGPVWSLQQLAELTIPALCDWCAIDGLNESGELERWIQAAADPEVLRIITRLRSEYALSAEWAAHPTSVLRTGKPELWPEISDTELASFAQDPEHLALIRSLGARSRILVPLFSRGAPLGVLTLVMGSGRRHTERHLELAMEVARRASLAIDNQRLLAELRQANQAKENFLAILGHELRNPLAPMRNVLARWDEEGQSWPGHERDLEVLNRHMAHVERLVDDLLDVARIARGKIELRLAPVDLRLLVERAVDTCRPEFIEREQCLSVEIPDEGVWIRADSTRIEQVLINLLTNASKYTQQGGKIALCVQREGESVRVAVRDNGIGIAPELLVRVFDLFMQADQALDRREGGLGLGLTLVRNLVQLHGGTVEAESGGPGQGSEFRVRLPLIDPPAASAGPSIRLNLKPQRSLRVMVVDDNRDAADTLCELLAAWKHVSECFYDGESALVAAAAAPPDVVLLDIGLPGTDGYTVAGRLQELPTPPGLLVAVTGYGQPQDRQRAWEAGFDHHFTKPVDYERLRQLLAEHSRADGQLST